MSKPEDCRGPETRAAELPGAVYLLLLDGAEEEAALAVGKWCLFHDAGSRDPGAPESARRRGPELLHAHPARREAQDLDVIKARGRRCERGGWRSLVRMLTARRARAPSRRRGAEPPRAAPFCTEELCLLLTCRAQK